jgi:hypothetical protein
MRQRLSAVVTVGVDFPGAIPRKVREHGRAFHFTAKVTTRYSAQFSQRVCCVLQEARGDKMEKWKSRIETLANIGIIICCILFVAFLIRSYVFPGNTQSDVGNSPPGMSLKGKALGGSDIDWSKNQQTALVVLRKDCRFCDESAPFYQRLAKELSGQTKTHLVAVLPGSMEENKRYLKDKMLEVEDVRSASLSAMGVRGTPTLLLVDNTGKVVEEWFGKLPAAREDEVIARLKQ